MTLGPNVTITKQTAGSTADLKNNLTDTITVTRHAMGASSPRRSRSQEDRRAANLRAVDRIQLHGMSFQGRHGVRATERERPQEFKVDLEVDCDLSKPGRTDQLGDTIDYTKLRAIAREVVEGDSLSLLETLATRIADRVLDVPKVIGVSVTVAKRPASMQPIESASVHINRTRA